MCNFGEPAQHFVFTGEDIIAHDGQQRQSLADKKLRRWIINNIDTYNWQQSYVVPYTDQNEIWTVIPLKGSSLPNFALVWNVVDATFSFRLLQNAAYIATGVDPTLPGSFTWDSAVGSWNANTQVWKPAEASTYQRVPIQADPTDVSLIRLDQGQQYLGANYDCVVERTGLALVGLTQSGEPLSNKDARKLVRGMWISASGNPFTVQVGRQHEIEGPVTWGASLPFIPGTDVYVGALDDTDEDQACRLFGLRFSWANQAVGELNSIDVDVEPLGEW